MRKNLILFLSLLLFCSKSSSASWPIGKPADPYQEEIKKIEKLEEKELKKKLKKIRKLKEKIHSEKNDENSVDNNQDLTKQGQVDFEEANYESENEESTKNNQKSKKEKRSKSKEKSQQKNEKIKSSSDSIEVKELRKELKENEKKALDFILPLEKEEDLKDSEELFSKAEKEQLLELWRATLVRNRSIQFIIKSLSSNPDDYEKNNAVTQTLTRALFVPFYAVSSVSNNALVSGGSAVGARVLGDVVDAHNDDKDRTKQISKTDRTVMFMLVDEVAQRLKQSYYTYKSARIQKQLLELEMESARAEALEATEIPKNDSSVFFTRMVVHDLERKIRENNLEYQSSRHQLVELAGPEALDSVDLLIDMEIEKGL